MTTKKTAIKGTFLLSAGRGMERGFQFLRNVIVARIVSPEDFGIAALFVMTVSFLETLSNLAVDTLLIQSREGEKPRFQQTSQMIIAVRGLGLALLLLIFAGPVAKLFDIPKATWAFRLLAVVPLIRGLAHQDISRFQKQLNFKPRLITDVSSQAVSVLFAWPLAIWLGDYSAILFLIIIQTLVRTIASHLLAERSYSWGWEPIHAREIIAFGWPLLINGILLFLIMQGDRLVIGAADSLFSRVTYSKTLLGYYSAAFVISTVADEAIWSVISPVMLPLLAKAQDCISQFLKLYQFLVHVIILFAAPLGIFFILMGGWLMGLVYGKQYLAAEPLIVWLGAAQSIRLIRRTPILAALSMGDSRIPPMSSAFRAVSFALCFILAAKGADIVWIAASSLFGELLALGVSVALLRYRFEIPIEIFIKSFLFPAAGLCLSGIIWKSGILSSNPLFSFLAACFLSISIAAFFLLIFKDFREEVRAIIIPIVRPKSKS
jgi:O-antigen/teichoic acid export membrane protein